MRIQRVGGICGLDSPLKNCINIGFLSKPGWEPLKRNHKATKPAYHVGPSSACQQNTILMAFRTAYSHIWILYSQLKNNNKKKNCQCWTPSGKTCWTPSGKTFWIHTGSCWNYKSFITQFLPNFIYESFYKNEAFWAIFFFFCKNNTTNFSSPEPLAHGELLWSLDVWRVSSIVNNCFKGHLLNCLVDFDQTL